MSDSEYVNIVYMYIYNVKIYEHKKCHFCHDFRFIEHNCLKCLKVLCKHGENSQSI